VRLIGKGDVLLANKTVTRAVGVNCAETFIERGVSVAAVDGTREAKTIGKMDRRCLYKISDLLYMLITSFNSCGSSCFITAREACTPQQSYRLRIQYP